MAASSVRSWRTAFLTLRDETLTSPPRTSIHILLQNLIFSQTDTLIAAAPDLPPHEVTSDVIFLVELAETTWECVEDMANTSIHICHLIHDVSYRVSLEINSSSWAIMLAFLGKMVDFFFGKADKKKILLGDAARVKATMESLDTLRYLINGYGRRCSPSETTQLVKLLLRLVVCTHAELCCSFSSSGSQRCAADRDLKYNSLWEVQTIAFAMIGEAFSRVGLSVPVDMWQSTLEVLRKMMDLLASKSLLVEDNVMSRYYTSLLHCLHLVLSDPKGSLSEHVAGFVAALRMFFVYGLSNKPLQVFQDTGYKEKELSSMCLKSSLPESINTKCGPYRPPHIRKREGMCMQQPKALVSQSFSDHEPFLVGLTSSDSEYSDSDGSVKDVDNFRSSKTRVAAIYCIQVAEYKESTKCGSFTALSSTLGQILMQLHTGILYSIQRETHSGLLASLYKILMLLISATPYSRMPGELLPTVISSLKARIIEGFPFKTDQTGLLAIALNCLGAALSTSPPSHYVKEMLQEEISTGFLEVKEKPSVLLAIFQFSERVTNMTISFEALQVLRAVSHNYPSIMPACWEQVSTIVYGLLRLATTDVPSSEVSMRPLKGEVGNTMGSIGEKFITAAIKVLDECLRAISGFKGIEDLLDDRLLDTPFTSDCTRTKRISSAPSYGLESPEDQKGDPKAYPLGSKQWCEAIEKHLPLVLFHISPMVRAASVTCFAGITSSVFFSLTEEMQDFVLSCSISAALNDEVPSVRSAACRAIGVIACFPQISYRAKILEKFVHAAEFNTHDSLVSVRITASWALANICDSLSRNTSDFPLESCSADPKMNSRSIALLADCALRLTKDGDKIKSNAVRALGNLSRFVRFININQVDSAGLSLTTNSIYVLPSSNESKASHSPKASTNVFEPASFRDSHWLDKMVQAFLSCVATGNVKVQWNVCHALSNLFLNETLRLQNMAWAPSVFSILLLLLRDSSNFKIRIHAAAALAVPASRLDYGGSFSDVVQGLEHILESLGSDQISTPSSFKYRAALEKQLISTTLHVLSLASCTDQQPLKDFLVKKACFLEEWFNTLCSSLVENSTQPMVEVTSTDKNDESSPSTQKKGMIYKAIRSLVEVYEGSNHQGIARRFEKLINSIL
ncbi:hypothetical protein HHK36_027333 [Tetracentron sinense]|uniref:DUF4042 domain-containing protein n=1 Tax=Tetracentron sinense TaxID=13715 RepID=A0A834YCU6_TETSI|nr:hypothetical protein HHK36_027333 [Tetracentron sinense]